MGFKQLISRSFHNVELTDESFAFFITGCPLLQKLDLSSPVGLLNPVITAPNITQIHISDDGTETSTLTIACPKLITLDVLITRIVLSVNGLFFHELSCAVCCLKMERGSSLVKLWLQVLDEHATNISFATLIDIVSNFKSLKKLLIHIREEWIEGENTDMDVPLFRLLEGLPHLEFLHMDGLFAQVK